MFANVINVVRASHAKSLVRVGCEWVVYAYTVLVFQRVLRGWRSGSLPPNLQEGVASLLLRHGVEGVDH